MYYKRIELDFIHFIRHRLVQILCIGDGFFEGNNGNLGGCLMYRRWSLVTDQAVMDKQWITTFYDLVYHI